MKSMTQIIKQGILEFCSDGKPHTLKEIYAYIDANVTPLTPGGSIVRNVVCILKRENDAFKNVGKGVYCLTAPADHGTASSIPEGFKIVTPDTIDPQRMRFGILESGKLTLNKALSGSLPTRDLQIYISADCKSVILVPNGPQSHRFTKAGTSKNANLHQLLKRHHVALPAYYSGDWEPSHSRWEGQLTPSKGPTCTSQDKKSKK